MYSQKMIEKTTAKLAAQLCRLCPSPEILSDEDQESLKKTEITEALWNHCQRHGTASLVYHNLKSNRLIDHLPQTTASHFHKSYYRTLASNLSHSETLGELAATISSTPIIVLKGLVLINTVYKNPALRPMTDIDILVRPEDHNAIKEHLQNLSFAPAPNYPDTFMRNNDQIDVHTHPFNIDRISARNIATPLKIENVWKTAQPFTEYAPFLQLDLPHQILTLSVHALKHGFERNIWLIDILGCINQASTSAQWEAVLDCCQKSKSDQILAYTIHAIKNRLKDPLNDQGENLQKSFPIGPIRRKILAVGNPLGDFQLLEPLVVMQAMPGIRQKVRCLYEFVFPRKVVLAQISGLSGKWTFYLSYPLRIVQLAIHGSIQAARLAKFLIFR